MRPTNPQHANTQRDAAVRTVRKLREGGCVAYFAGGCVRDELLGLVPDDYDVATDATPARVKAIFPAAEEVGAAFGVMLVRGPRTRRGAGAVVEVATFRKEGPYSDSRRPDYVSFATAEEDAKRRDFTVNAMFLDPGGGHEPNQQEGLPGNARGRVIDLVGGLDDLRNGIVRAVGDPAARLAEDHLRGLRAVRFAARLGFGIDGDTADAIRRDAAMLVGVSPERVGVETSKVLGHTSRARAVGLLTELGLDGPVLGLEPGGDAGAVQSAVRAFERVDPGGLAGGVGGAGTGCGPAATLAVWAAARLGNGGDDPASLRNEAAEGTRRLRAAMRLSNDHLGVFRSTLEGAAVLLDDWLQKTVAVQKRSAASGWFVPAWRLVTSRQEPLGTAIAQRVAALASTNSGIAPVQLLDGGAVLAVGAAPGPAVGELLRRLYDAQLEDTVRTKAQAEAFVRKAIRG